jgi:hypothetical protein
MRKSGVGCQVSGVGEDYETPAYLQAVEPLPAPLLVLVEEGEIRDLTRRELWELEIGLLAACRRVRRARRARDGHD